jgi:hypothetical protein
MSAVLNFLGAVVIAASIMFVGRYEIAPAQSLAPNSDYGHVWRLDRWSGNIRICSSKFLSFEVVCISADGIPDKR